MSATERPQAPSMRAIGSAEIRERYLSFFEERGHLRLPSASLVPSEHDPSALLTVAGMHPLKPYFLGVERPPAARLTDCQKCFRTVDIGQVGLTSRHLTFFEMLGNFSIGDYFKQEAIAFAWELSLEVFGFDPALIWVTVFAGDEELGLGADEEAIAFWRQMGVPAERIVRCGRSENFWQAGPTGPCGPCSELYLDRGVDHGSADDLPGGDNERFLEYWNLVFMQYDQRRPGELAELPARNIDTGLGLNRLAAILQGKESVFETDQFQPLIELGCELSGARYGADHAADRALRVLADHSRAMTFLIADGIVPSNEDRGYVLRRVMRRAIHQARKLELDEGFLVRFSRRVRELMGDAYPELPRQADAIDMWLQAEEDSFSRTLAQGLAELDQLIEAAQDAGADQIAAADAFRLHDTSGFPFDLTRELLAERSMSVDEPAFEALMAQQRQRARAAAGGRADASAAEGDGAIARDGAGVLPSRAQALQELRQAAEQSHFSGYEAVEQETAVLAALQINDGAEAAGGRWLLKLADSPFYAVGGGQVADQGAIETLAGEARATVVDVLRSGDDQALEVLVQAGGFQPHDRVIARVDRARRFATECNHTATHLLHAALRGSLGAHVRQAGSYVGPDKLRFDFAHTAGLSAAERDQIEQQVNAWIACDDAVQPVQTTRSEAEALGAMALFGEKYGDVVRMVEIGGGDYSRELCGGTHVRYTGEIGAFVILAETSSAANVRRIEALTGPSAVAYLRSRSQSLQEIAGSLRTRVEQAPEALRQLIAERDELAGRLRAGAAEQSASAQQRQLEALADSAQRVTGEDGAAALLAATVEAGEARELLALLEQLQRRLGDAALLLASVAGERVILVAAVSPALLAKGLDARQLIALAGEHVEGKGGGRELLAQGGGRNPARLPEAIEAVQAHLRAKLGA